MSPYSLIPRRSQNDLSSVPDMQYKAFISYSQATDSQLAPVLQSALQGFAKPFYRLRALRIFRDKTGLSLTPELWPAIEQAIGESEYFILLASPEAAASPWVRLEVEEWLKLNGGSVEKFLVVLTGGEIAWDAAVGDFDWERTNALPRNLEGMFRSLPLYSDLRWARGANDLSLRHPQFLDDVGSIGAKLHGKPKDVMIGKDVRQHHVFKAAAGVTILLLFLLSIAALVAAYSANVQRRVAEQQTVIANEQRAEAERQKNEAQRQRDEADTQRRLAVQAANSEKTAREGEAEQRKTAELATENEKVARGQAEERRIQAEKSAENERAARKDAETQTKRANEAFRTLLIESGRQESTNHNPFQAATYLSKAYKMFPPDEDPVKTSSIRFLLGLSMRSVDSLRYSKSYPEDINSVKFSPVGDRIAIACADNTPNTDNTARVLEVKTGEETIGAVIHKYDVNTAEFSFDGRLLVTSSDDNFAKVRDLKTGDEISFEHRTDVKSAVFSPDATKVATVDADDKAAIWDVEKSWGLKTTKPGDLIATKKILTAVNKDEYVYSVAFSPDLRRIVIVGYEGRVLVWDIKKNEVVGSLEHQGKVNSLWEYRGKVNSAKFSPDGGKLVTTGIDKTAQVLDLTTGKPVTLRHQYDVVAAEFSPDGKRIVTISSDKKAYVWNVETATIVSSLQHEDDIKSARFSPNGERIVTASEDKTAKVWDVETGKILASMQHSGFVKSAEFSPDGKQIVTASHDKKVKLWNVETEMLATVPHRGHVISARFSIDGTRVVTASEDKTAKVLDMKTRLITTLKHDRTVWTAEFSPDGEKVVTSSGKAARVWDVKTEKVIHTVPHSDTCWSAEFSPDGTQIVTASRDGTAKVMDLKTERIISFPHGRDVNTAKFSPDGKRIVTANGDASSTEGTAKVWDVKKIWDEETWDRGTEWQVKPEDVVATVEHKGGVISARFSPDGERIATASFDWTAKVYNLKTEKTFTIPHQQLVITTEFSPDGKRVVTASNDRTASIWNVDTETLVTTVEHQEKRVRSAKFSPDGKQIVTAGEDKTARVWDADTGKLLASIEHRQMVRSAEFSRDGKQIATSGWDEVAKVWNFAPETRDADKIEEIVRFKVPFSLVDGALVPRQDVFDK